MSIAAHGPMSFVQVDALSILQATSLHYSRVIVRASLQRSRCLRSANIRDHLTRVEIESQTAQQALCLLECRSLATIFAIVAVRPQNHSSIDRGWWDPHSMDQISSRLLPQRFIPEIADGYVSLPLESGTNLTVHIRGNRIETSLTQHHMTFFAKSWVVLARSH